MQEFIIAEKSLTGDVEDLLFSKLMKHRSFSFGEREGDRGWVLKI